MRARRTARRSTPPVNPNYGRHDTFARLHLNLNIERTVQKEHFVKFMVMFWNSLFDLILLI